MRTPTVHASSEWYESAEREYRAIVASHGAFASFKTTAAHGGVYHRATAELARCDPRVSHTGRDGMADEEYGDDVGNDDGTPPEDGTVAYGGQCTVTCPKCQESCTLGRGHRSDDPPLSHNCYGHHSWD
jgi:hypothetical protein